MPGIKNNGSEGDNIRDKSCFLLSWLRHKNLLHYSLVLQISYHPHRTVWPEILVRRLSCDFQTNFIPTSQLLKQVGRGWGQ